MRVRLRLTFWYGGLFVLSGVALLAITYLLERHFIGRIQLTTDPQLTDSSASMGHLPPPGLPQHPSPSAVSRIHRSYLHQLLALSGIALGIMTLMSIWLGWLFAGRVLGRMEAAMAAQRRFVANASHELRTPLAMMRTSVDVAVCKPGPIPPAVTVLAGKLREGLDQADRLIESFLALARAQEGAITDLIRVSLAQVVGAVLASHATLASARGIRVRRQVGHMEITGSRTLLVRMVANVLDNAFKHCGDGGTVFVHTETDGRTARLIIDSSGQPLDEAEVRRLGEPFQRLGAQRTASSDGVGLGLSIVSAIAAAHGGSLALRARPEGGLRVVIELPRSRQPALAGAA
jgi:hypothetical protein